MSLPLTPEQAEWMKRVAPSQERRMRPVKQETAIPNPVFTSLEIEWLWPRFQRCRHRMGSFEKSFAKTALGRLTPRGLACLHTVTFPYRVQIFAVLFTPKEARRWSVDQFVAAVKRCAADNAKGGEA